LRENFNNFNNKASSTCYGQYTTEPQDSDISKNFSSVKNKECKWVELGVTYSKGSGPLMWAVRKNLNLTKRRSW